VLWLGEELVGEIGRAKGDAFGEVSQEVFDRKFFLANLGAGKAIFQIS
jgi:hypothetical protein